MGYNYMGFTPGMTCVYKDGGILECGPSEDYMVPEELPEEEGEETEQIKINTSSIVHVPRGLLHLPLFLRNVKRPIIHLVIGLNIGETLQSTIRVPLRGV